MLRGSNFLIIGIVPFIDDSCSCLVQTLTQGSPFGTAKCRFCRVEYRSPLTLEVWHRASPLPATRICTKLSARYAIDTAGSSCPGKHFPGCHYRRTLTTFAHVVFQHWPAIVARWAQCVLAFQAGFVSLEVGLFRATNCSLMGGE